MKLKLFFFTLIVIFLLNCFLISAQDEEDYPENYVNKLNINEITGTIENSIFINLDTSELIIDLSSTGKKYIIDLDNGYLTESNVNLQDSKYQKIGSINSKGSFEEINGVISSLSSNSNYNNFLSNINRLKILSSQSTTQPSQPNPQKTSAIKSGRNFAKIENIQSLINEYNDLSVDFEGDKIRYQDLIERSANSQVSSQALYDKALGYKTIAEIQRDYEGIEVISTTHYKGIGEQCTSDDDCQADYTCINQICSLKVTIPPNNKEPPKTSTTFKYSDCNSCEDDKSNSGVKCTKGECIAINGCEWAAKSLGQEIIQLLPWLEGDGKCTSKSGAGAYTNNGRGGPALTQEINTILDKYHANFCQNTRCNNKCQNNIRTIWNKYNSFIIEGANKYNVPVEIMLGIISHESSGNPNLISTSGCVGLGQVCSDSNEISKKTKCCSNCNDIISSGGNDANINNKFDCNINNDERFNPQKNILASYDIITQKFKSFNSQDPRFGIASYLGLNPTPINKEIKSTNKESYDNLIAEIPNENQEYVKDVMCRVNLAREMFKSSTSQKQAPVTTQSTTGLTILSIGDSHLAGSYGISLKSNLNSLGNVIQYACVSATANSYINGDLKCDRGSKDNNDKDNFDLPKISDLISTYNPKMIIISLGANFISDSNQASALLDQINRIECYWIGPPTAPAKSYNINTLNTFNNEIKQLVESKGCKYISSIEDTKSFNFAGDDPHFDNYKDGPAVAKNWGKNIASQILASHTSRSNSVVASVGSPGSPRDINSKKFLMIGDSHFDKDYPNQKAPANNNLGADLTNIFQKQGYTVINDAKGGTTIAYWNANKIGQEISTNHPNAILISLGTNSCISPQNPKNTGTQDDPIPCAFNKVDTTQKTQVLIKAIPESIPCYWIGPPQIKTAIFEGAGGKFYKLENSFIDPIYEAINKGNPNNHCLLIDSRKIITPEMHVADNIHLEGISAQTWAENVYNAIIADNKLTK